ncbi:MAG TPA: hypothetical protein VFI33_20720 [Puia sp.]|nr:hypothetical protein [Puia sp.]
MLSQKKEIALLQSQIKQQELKFDQSMSAGEEFAKTKVIFHELKKMLARLEELKNNWVLNKTENHQ